MRNVILFLFIFLTLALVVSTIGCSSGSDVAMSNDSAIIRMMKVLPDDVTTIEYYDFHRLRTDDDLSSIWDNYPAFQKYFDESAHHYCLVRSASGLLMLADGGYNFQDLCSENTCESYIYGDFKVTREFYTNITAVMINGISISGTNDDVLKRCIDAANNEEISLYSNEDPQDIVSQLPEGYYLSLMFLNNMNTNDYSEGALDYLLQGAENTGLLALGQSLTKQDTNYLNIMVWKFKDEDAARTYVEYPVSNTTFNRTRDGEFVTIIYTSVTPFEPH